MQARYVCPSIQQFVSPKSLLCGCLSSSIVRENEHQDPIILFFYFVSSVMPAISKRRHSVDRQKASLFYGAPQRLDTKNSLFAHLPHDTILKRFVLDYCIERVKSLFRLFYLPFHRIHPYLSTNRRQRRRNRSQVADHFQFLLLKLRIQVKFFHYKFPYIKNSNHNGRLVGTPY